MPYQIGTKRSSTAASCVVASERENHSNRSIEERRKQNSVSFLLLWFLVVMVMEYNKRKPLLVLLVLSCLLLPLVSSVPLSRSVSLRNHQTSASDLVAPVQDVVAAKEPSIGEVAARMVIEVNDYPGSGANNRHDPKSPGRA